MIREYHVRFCENFRLKCLDLLVKGSVSIELDGGPGVMRRNVVDVTIGYECASSRLCVHQETGHVLELGGLDGRGGIVEIGVRVRPVPILKSLFCGEGGCVAGR